MTSTSNPIREKSYAFAKEIIFLYQSLTANNEYILSKQLLRSGTSIGANVEEAHQSQSRRDFLSKMKIALKEAYEVRYWILLLADTGYISIEQKSLHIESITEIIKILVVIVSRTRARLNQQ